MASFIERPIYFSCGETSLAGILIVPNEPNGITIVIPWGGGAFPSSGPNRIRARLARELGELGFHTFRFDNPGVGESDGDYQEPNLERPYVHEIIAACDLLAAQSLDRLILVGNCFGGWSSLMAAPLIDGLEGIVVVNSPVRRDHKQLQAVTMSMTWWISRLKRMTISKLRSPDRRALYRRLVAAKALSLIRDPTDSRFFRGIQYLLTRNIPILLVYGTDDFRTDLDSELENGLRPLIEEAGLPSRVVTVAERLEGYASVAAQDSLFRTVLPWLRELAETEAGN